MDAITQIGEKIKELSESNSIRAEAADEADKRMSEEGYHKEPKAEQVPKPEKMPERSVSVIRQKKPSGTAEISEKEDGPVQEETAAEKEPARKEDRILSESLSSFEKMLEEGKGSTQRETVAAPPKKRLEDEEPGTVNRMPSKLRGPHRKGRPRTRIVEAEKPKDKSFCLINPVTGEISPIIRDETVIGRSSTADIVVNNRYISGTHARIIKKSGEYFLRDIGSTNGTRINGTRIEQGEDIALKPGDIIRLAATDIVFDTLD